MTKTRITLASLLTLGVLARLALTTTPALAKNERVYTSVFGGEVNKTKVQQREKEVTEKGSSIVTPAEENLCTVASGNECQAGKQVIARFELEPGQFKFERGDLGELFPDPVAVNDETGDVYVAEESGRVQEFNAEGKYLTQFSAGEGVGIAVDNSCALHKPFPLTELTTPSCKEFDPSDGDVYVSSSRSEAVFKFSAAGAPLEPITTGSEAHRIKSFGVAVNPEGTVFVPSKETIASGEEIERYSDAEPNLLLPQLLLPYIQGGITAFAVDSADDLYFLRYTHLFEKVNSSGQVLIRDVDQEKSSATAVEPASNDVYVDNEGSIAKLGPAPGCTAASPCQTDPEPIESFGAGHLFESTGVGVNASDETVYAANVASQDVAVFVKASVPNVVTGEPTKPEVEGSITLNGKVNPEGVEVTSCEFEYGPTSSYGTVVPCPAGIVGSSKSEELPVSVELTGLTPDTLYHYRLIAGYAGQNEVNYGPDQTFVAGALPKIEAEAIEGVSSGEATLTAAINPGGLATTYQVQYGPCPEPYEPGTCAAAPYPSSTPDVSAGAGFGATGVRVRLRGLAAGTVYHARVLASNAIDSGAPASGGVLVFTTASSTGPSSSTLPDDRTYELVSPATGDADVFVPVAMEDELTMIEGYNGIPTEYPSETAAAGDAVIYYGGPGPTGGNGSYHDGHGNGYLATRSPGGGWTAVNTSTPGGRPGFSLQGAPLPDPFALANAGTSAVPAAAHTLTLGKGNESERVGDLFDDLGGTSIQVNVLNEGKVEPDAQFGSEEPGSNGFHSPDTSNVISADGSRIYWSAVETVLRGSNTVYIPKALYLRVNDTQPQSPLKGSRCTVPADACTVQVDARQGGPGASGGGRFLTATPNGELVFFTDASRLTLQSGAAPGEPDLYEYDLGAPVGKRLTDLTVAPAGQHADVQGLVGSSVDGEYIYFVADGVLASNANSNGDTAKAGEDNLYLLHAGSTTFIATLSGADNDFGATPKNGDWIADPGLHTANVTPGGHSVVFMSRAPLTGYDSRAEGTALTEVFVYDADTAQLSCASCDPGVAPVVPAPIRAIGVGRGGLAELWGSFLPTSYSQVGYQQRLISDDGDRVFFMSFEPLVPQATNGWLDVYEWEREGTETTAGSGVSSCPLTTPSRSSGGCVFLISSPSSNENSYLLETDATGENVFFITRADLVPADRGGDRDLLYDARVNGYEPPAQATCSGTGCQGVPPPPPIFATPSSVTFNGLGNFPPAVPTVVKPKPKTVKCAKGKKLKHGKCTKVKTKKKNSKAKKSAHTDRRAPR